jgi:hypothetical protein
MDFFDVEFNPNTFRGLENEIMNAVKYIEKGGGVLCVSCVHGTAILMLSLLVSAYPPIRTWRRPALEGRNLTQYGAQNPLTCGHFPPVPMTDLD